MVPIAIPGPPAFVPVPRPVGTPRTGPTASQRVGDVERDEVHVLLGQALALGYLDDEEFGVRTNAAFAARTGADLARLTSDLPVSELQRRDPVRRAALARRARMGVRIHAGAFLLFTVLLVALWLTTALDAGDWYPWPLWPTLGWGIGVVSHALPGHLALKRSDRT
jgi:hypothetical protein